MQKKTLMEKIKANVAGGVEWLKGKEYVTAPGLLYAATLIARERGHDSITSIKAELLSNDGKIATFKAVVTIGDSVYTGHGDCTSPANDDWLNCGRNIAPHFIRMAETRAVNRALRYAIGGILGCSAEEMSDFDNLQIIQGAQQIPAKAAGAPAAPAINGIEEIHERDKQLSRYHNAAHAFKTAGATQEQLDRLDRLMLHNCAAKSFDDILTHQWAHVLDYVVEVFKSKDMSTIDRDYEHALNNEGLT